MSAFGTEHSAYTVEGRIEAVGQLARGMNRASDAQWRAVGRLFVATIAAIFVIGSVAWLIGRLVG